jgi:hypothetical protein
MVVAGVPAPRIRTSSFGWAVPVTRPDNVGPKALPVITAIRAEGDRDRDRGTGRLSARRTAYAGHLASPVDGFAYLVLLRLVPPAAAADPLTFGKEEPGPARD